MKDLIEKRARVTELRMGGEGDEAKSRKISGYAVVYDEWTTIGGWYREKIAAGALTEAIKNSDVRLLFNHDTSQLLARQKSGTLTIREDAKGLYFEAELSATRDDILSMIERGDLDECSFAFRESKSTWRWASENDDLEMDERIVETISEMPEITLATFGAYPTTEVGLRSYEAAKAEAENRNSQDAENEEQNKIKEQSAKRARTLDLLSYTL